MGRWLDRQRRPAVLLCERELGAQPLQVRAPELVAGPLVGPGGIPVREDGVRAVRRQPPRGDLVQVRGGHRVAG